MAAAAESSAAFASASPGRHWVFGAMAREITRLLADNPDALSPGDVALAVNNYRSVYEFLNEEYTAP